MIKSLLNKKEMRHTKWFLGCLGLLLSANVAFAQDKAAYFNRNLHVANQLNPAILPERGYLALPFIGGFRIDGATDFTNLSDLIYAISADEKVLNDDSFYDQMKPDNRMNLDMNVNVLSVGWWRGANFWSVNVGLKLSFGASVPKSLFEYMRDLNLYEDSDLHMQNVDIRNFQLNTRAYSDIGVGYARQLTECLSVGARAKLLLGFADIDFKVDEMVLDMNLPDYPDSPESWTTGANYGGYSAAKGHLRTAYNGGGLTFDEQGQVDEFALDGFGIAGYGLGVDLGVAYSPIDHLNLSASVTDLGFLKWREEAISIASVDNSEQVEITYENYDRYLGDDIFNPSRYNLTEDEPESYKTGLRTTLSVGADYRLGAQEQFSVGSLYNIRFSEPFNRSTISLVGGYAPKGSSFNASLAYSYIQSTGNALEALIKFGNSFIGANYVLAGEQASFGVYLGMSIPLGAIRE